MSLHEYYVTCDLSMDTNQGWWSFGMCEWLVKSSMCLMGLSQYSLQNGLVGVGVRNLENRNLRHGGSYNVDRVNSKTTIIWTHVYIVNSVISAYGKPKCT